MSLINDLRSRINPMYAATPGTESYERRLCAEEMDRLTSENEHLKACLKRLIRMYLVDDQACNQEKETEERFTRMMEDENSCKS